jgi:hypothetical protein
MNRGHCRVAAVNPTAIDERPNPFDEHEILQWKPRYRSALTARPALFKNRTKMERN